MFAYTAAYLFEILGVQIVRFVVVYSFNRKILTSPYVIVYFRCLPQPLICKFAIRNLLTRFRNGIRVSSIPASDLNIF